MKLFKLGDVIATPGALDALEESREDFGRFLALHASGNWGTVCKEDWEVNDDAVKCGDRILSSYKLENGETIWIITDATRECTTILLPSEY